MMQEKRKVLIVDDDEGARAFVQAIMESEGWDTFEALDGQECLDMAGAHKPDLIILDVSMPVMDGFEAFRRLRSDIFTRDIPIVMLTAINDLDPKGGHNEVTMEKRFGVTRPEGFVDKPVDPTFLLDTIFGVVGDAGI